MAERLGRVEEWLVDDLIEVLPFAEKVKPRRLGGGPIGDRDEMRAFDTPSP